nr:nitrile hydratase subunit alpha [Planktothrix agardhii]
MQDPSPHNHHEHETFVDNHQPLTDYQLLTLAIQELLIEKGIVTATAVRETIEAMDARSPALGAKMVVRAWLDSNYKARLLTDCKTAAWELGIDIGSSRVVVVENTPQVHNVIVCTLCSCYPRMILGLPPDWYKNKAYRSRVVREPRAVIAEFGTIIPDHVEIRVHDSTAEMRYLVLPQRPEGTEELDEEALVSWVTRDSMIGVSFPKQPNLN